MLPFVAPAFQVKIGRFVITKVQAFDARSSWSAPVGTAEVQVPVDAPVSREDPVEIWQGYRERGLWLVFAGTVKDLRPSGNLVTICCRDRMDALTEVAVTQSFMNVLPDVVVRYCLARAGVDAVRLGAPRAQARSFVARNEPVIDILRRVNRLWDLAWPYYFEPEGEFVWMPVEESPRYSMDTGVVLEYGENLLEHRARQGLSEGVLETVAIPWVRHSMRLAIRDPRYWEGVRRVVVKGVRYRQEGVKARTVIEWQAETS